MIHIISFWVFILFILGVILYRKLLVKTAKNAVKEADKAADLINDEEETIEINKD